MSTGGALDFGGDLEGGGVKNGLPQLGHGGGGFLGGGPLISVFS